MKKLLYFFTLIIGLTSCDDYLEVQPVGQVIPKSVEDYRSFLTSAYSITNLGKILTSYRSDELRLNPNASGIEQYEDIFIWNDRNASPLTRSFPYGSFYTIIFYCNHIIENQNNIEGDQNSIDQLVGEAYALRAMQYFELVNLYAKPYDKNATNEEPAVPIVTKYDAEKAYPKESLEDVYTQILTDLEQAQALVKVSQQEEGLNYRFSKIAVLAFRARVALYQQDWEEAIAFSEEALSIKSGIQNLNDNASIMPSEYNSVESILALENVADLELVAKASISDDLIAAYDPESDLRFSLYFEQYNDGRYHSKKSAQNKFKVSYRTSELYFIIAESLAHLNQTDSAKETLLDFAENRYTPSGFSAYQDFINTLDNESLLTEILKERRREFAIEGHRWNDLRRTTQPEIRKTYNGNSYTLEEGDERYTLLLPNDAIINNPDL